MRVEYDEQPNYRTKRKKKSGRSGVHALIFLLMIALSAVIALCLTVWFNIGRIEVVGDSIYSPEQIVAASGIKQDDNLFRVNTAFAKSNIEKALPYVSDVKVTRKLPGTVKLEVSAGTEYAYINQNTGAVIIDANMKVLKDFAAPEASTIHLKGVQFNNYTVGEKLEFSGAEQNEALDELFGSLNTLGLHKGEFNVTMVDVTDVFDIKFILDDRYYVKAGSLNNIDKKLVHLKAMLQHIDKSISGQINLADWAEDNYKSIFKPCNIDEFK